MLFGWCLLDEHAVPRTIQKQQRTKTEKKSEQRKNDRNEKEQKSVSKLKLSFRFAVSVWHVFVIEMYNHCTVFRTARNDERWTLNAECLNWLRRYVHSSYIDMTILYYYLHIEFGKIDGLDFCMSAGSIDHVSIQLRFEHQSTHMFKQPTVFACRNLYIIEIIHFYRGIHIIRISELRKSL